MVKILKSLESGNPGQSSGEFSPNTTGLTACRAGDRVVNSQKGRLNFPFTITQDTGIGSDHDRPYALLPELPTVASAGLPGYEATGMICVFVPAKTSTAIINRLNQEIVRVPRFPEIKNKFLAVGAETVGSTPQELAAIIKADMANMEKAIREGGIKAD